MPTVNYSLVPSDGWVQIADSPKFVRTSGFPHTQPYYLYAGSAAPSLVATRSTGTVTFATGVPLADETVTIGSETFTFKAAAVNPFEVTIGATNLLTAANFKAAVNADSTLVTAAITTNVVTLTAVLVGSVGNYALTEAATNVSVGAATLTGGSSTISQGVLVVHHPFKVNVTMAEKLFARTVTEPADGTSFRLDVFTIS